VRRTSSGRTAFFPSLTSGDVGVGGGGGGDGGGDGEAQTHGGSRSLTAIAVRREEPSSSWLDTLDSPARSLTPASHGGSGSRSSGGGSGSGGDSGGRLFFRDGDTKQARKPIPIFIHKP